MSSDKSLIFINYVSKSVGFLWFYVLKSVILQHIHVFINVTTCRNDVSKRVIF